MRSFASSSCSNSFSSYSLASTSLNSRLDTIFKKASELSTLCEIEACVIYYGPDGELKTWPEERQKVRDIALRYSQLNEAQRHKKSVDLYGFLNKKNDKEIKNLKKRARRTSLQNMNELKYPISDHYSPDQISKLIQSLELNISTLQKRLGLVESQKQKDTKLDHQSLNLMPLNHHDQTQSLNPNQFSLFMYNHGDATLPQIPLSASNYNQDFSAFVPQPGLTNHIIDQELCGYHQNNNSFQHLFVSNTEPDSAVQDPITNFELNQLMQHEVWCYDQNMFTSDITNSNIPDPYLISNIVSDELCSDFHFSGQLW